MQHFALPAKKCQVVCVSDASFVSSHKVSNIWCICAPERGLHCAPRQDNAPAQSQFFALVLWHALQKSCVSVPVALCVSSFFSALLPAE